MSTPSRRAVIGQAASVAAITALGSAARAQAPLTRFNATSAKGKAMLRIYADAVRAMMAKDASDPLSWTFQWYMHAVPTNTSKAQALSQIFPTASPQKALANATWDTCEPHFSGAEDNFLPWHRMYVARFEAIIRAVSGRPDFTLPYWNYTASTTARKLPPEFRRNGDAVWGSLYRPDRNPTSNGGSAIDSFPGANPINLNAMKSPRYGDSGGDAGFCANLDGGLHGSVHVDVGDQMGMGSVPWAANDPIFWLHHCNIDRVWASWNKAGGKNLNDPAYKAESFTFAGADGKAAQMIVGDVLDTGQLNYVYDQYLARPAGSKPFPLAVPAAAAPNVVVKHAIPQAATGPIQLGSAATTVTLTAAPTPAAPSPGPKFSMQMKALPPTRTVYLRLNGLQADSEVGGGFDVYLNLPKGAKPSRASPAYVGTLNFFGVGVRHDHAAMAAGGTEHSGRSVSFEVKANARQAAKATDAPKVTFVPLGSIGAAAPRVSSVEIVSE